MTGTEARPPGATYRGESRCTFEVWAPFSRVVKLEIVEPSPRSVPLERDDLGYHRADVDAEPGTLYFFRLADGALRPDPASRSQPRGVHGPSEVVDPAFAWTDRSWSGIARADLVLYELHVGTFSEEGTFDGAIAHLDDLRELGVTAIELMPVAQFPGEWNWGYDGVDLYAVQSSYGGTSGLKRLVDACHARGLGVFLDVVYNHLGPEGNYLAHFGPYFTDAYRTPWGPALNFDGPHSDEVRRFFVENALRWIREFHVDGLRLDALHAILDRSARPFLEELAERVRGEAERANRAVHLIGESDANDARLLHPVEHGGPGLDAVWNDDFHHALHAVLTGERTGYYRDFGGLDQLGRALREGFVYSGQRSAYRRRRHGRPAGHLAPDRFVVFSQNHDQVGNRLAGERLGSLVPFEALKLAAAVVLLSPGVPLLFMGEEYGETAPFLYFTSHEDPALAEAVREGRKREFEAFGWTEPPPDPQDPETFRRSRLDRSLVKNARHGRLRDFYVELLRLRGSHPALAAGRGETEARALDDLRLAVTRRHGGREVLLAFNFAPEEAVAVIPAPEGTWSGVLDSSETRWGGPGGKIPSAVVSDGALRLALPGRGVVALERSQEV